jgi:hypothetical protein
MTAIFAPPVGIQCGAQMFTIGVTVFRLVSNCYPPNDDSWELERGVVVSCRESGWDGDTPPGLTILRPDGVYSNCRLSDSKAAPTLQGALALHGWLSPQVWCVRKQVRAIDAGLYQHILLCRAHDRRRRLALLEWEKNHPMPSLQSEGISP